MPTLQSRQPRARSVPATLPTSEETDAIVSLFQQHRYAEAEALARSLTTRFPHEGFGWKALGVMLQQQERLKEALEVKQQAAELLPHDAEVQNNLGNALLKLVRFDEAKLCYRRALAIQPEYPEAHSSLGITLQRLDRLAEGEAHCRRALELRPAYADASSNLGIILQEQGRLAEAEVSYHSAIEVDPNHADAWNNLGITLQKQGRLAEGEAAHRRAIAIKPRYADAHTNLAGCLQQQARLTEAEAEYRRAIEIDPDQMNAWTNMLFCLSHNIRITPEALFAEHLRFAEHFEAPLSPAWQPHTNSPERNRILHIGFVSADFREHAMSHFIEPIFTHLSRDPSLVLHAYANHAIEDAVTERLRGYVPNWNRITGLSDQALAEKIRTDAIDILIDLSGHTGGNRLLTFARKPAPIQCSWIGYLGTSGLKSMDYYLADQYFLAPGEFDRFFTETIAYLPASAPFQPNDAAPIVNSLPALANGYVTFGSFSRLGKLSREVIALWSQLLRAMPDSHLLLGAMPRDGHYEVLANWFAEEGIAADRLHYHAGCGMVDYLHLHHEVDLCLDPFPFTGATTTCHALWMGVPTLTLTGNTVPGRLGPAILLHLGLESVIATNHAEFVEKGLLWAQHLQELAALRATLRARFLQSPIGQPALVANGLSTKLRQLWCGWCAETGAPEGDPRPGPAETAELLALFQQGRDPEATIVARDFTECFPNSGFAWNLLGAIQERQEHFTEAEAAYREAIRADPSCIEACFNLGRRSFDDANFSEAERLYRRALTIKPGYLPALYSLGEALQVQGKLADAESCYRRAIDIDPRLAEAHNNVGIVLQLQGRINEAEASYRAAIEINPEFAEAHNNLALTLKHQGKPRDSEASCRRALQLKPGYADALSNLGLALQEQGRITEATGVFRHAIELKPDLIQAHSGLLFCLNHTAGISQQALFAEHLAFAERFEAPLRPAWPDHQNSRDPHRQLRVGLVSSDFRQHAMSHFIEPLFAHLAADSSLLLYAYSSHAIEDAVTARIRAQSIHWTSVFGLADQALAAKVLADRIDILIDLTGHTAGNRLLTFARKPAPIQCGWIGYLGSSGLRSMDYYFADEHFLPRGEFDNCFSEKLLYLPAIACFQPSSAAPPVNSLPALINGHITFGSFSRLAKLNRRVVALWAQLLCALPDSELVLAAMPSDGSLQIVADWFADEGIAPTRLRFYPSGDLAAYLKLHQQVDLCLDPFPFTGATTTCHALWMGVPTLTLVGDTVPGRLGPALLHHAGLDAFVAHSPAQFIGKGLFWADNLHQLAALRTTLREHFLHSPLGQPTAFAQCFSGALRRIWTSWCES